MTTFEVTDNSLIASNFAWAFNQTFNPLAQPPSKIQIARKVLNAIGKSGISSVEVNEEFRVNIYAGNRLVNYLSFKRIEDQSGDANSAVEVMQVQSLDFEVVWSFTNTQIIASTLKGTGEAVGGFLTALGNAFRIDDIKARIDKTKKEIKDKEEAFEKFKKDPLGTEDFFKDSDT